MLGLASLTSTFGLLNSASAVSSFASATSSSGNVKLDAEVSTSLVMKIVSPNDVNPNCTPEDLNNDDTIDSNDTYGVVNRYATSNGAEGSKQVDTFDGTVGGADEINENTSCATLSMSPNTFASTYSDITVYTNSPNGYALSLQSATPSLTNLSNSGYTIPAGTLIEQDGTGEQAGTKVVPGGQNKWAYKTNNGIITDWTAVTTLDTTIKSHDMETSGGEDTRVTYGISAGNNPTGTYATTLTYTATMFDGSNPYVGTIDTETVANLSISPTTMKIARNQTKSMSVTPASGYYLSSVTCPTGYVCTGYTTDISDDASTTTQTITIKNESATSVNAILGLTVSPRGMQGFSAAAHASDPVGTVYNSAEEMTDIRDGKIYSAKKLADGNIWMMKSLELDLPEGETKRTLTPSDSDVSADWDLEDYSDKRDGKLGWCSADSDACDNQKLISRIGYQNASTYYYNWYTATAGTGTRAKSSGDASDSICPKGWKLPTMAQFVALDKAYGGSGENRTDSAQITKFINLGFGITGERNVASIDYSTSDAFYWSRSAYSATDAYSLYYYTGAQRFRPQDHQFGDKWYGYVIRCVAS